MFWGILEGRGVVADLLAIAMLERKKKKIERSTAAREVGLV